MSDRPEDRRRTGPLGDDAEETRRVPPAQSDPEATRQVPAQQRPAQQDQASSETRRIPQGTTESSDKETRVIRTPGYSDTAGGEATPYPPGYFEAAEDREDRLRDMYGGVDWLASFLGFVFSLLAAALFSLIAGLVLVPLGTPNLGGGGLGAAVITGLAVLGLLVFLTYFFGGYVAGRLARFDGGRNGAMLLVWSFVAVLVIALAAGVFSGFLPAGVSSAVGNLLDGISSAVGDLAAAGAVGISVAVGALLLALLGGFLGGRLGARYHTEIDRSA